MKYKTIAIAGTFDHLHKGHEYFISKAFEFGGKVVIGLTSDEYVQKKFQIFKSQFSNIFQFPINVKKFDERKRELENYLKDQKLKERAEIVEIGDVYGPTLDKNDIEALVITKDTLSGGKIVNKKRIELGFQPLKLVEIPLLSAEDNKRISSTRIRLGEIDRWGRVFGKSKLFGGKISDLTRQKLKIPLGLLITGTSGEIKNRVKKIILELKPVVLIAVGDAATLFLNNLNYTPDISIVDYYIKRIRVHARLEDLKFPEQFYSSEYPNKIIKAKNPAGYITRDLTDAIKRSFVEVITDGRKRAIKVDGEEDLAGVPAILLAPLGSLVFYGQPRLGRGKPEGIVAVPVTEEKKKEIFEMGE